MRRRLLTQFPWFAGVVLLAGVGCFLPARWTHMLMVRPSHTLMLALTPLHYPLKRLNDVLISPGVGLSGLPGHDQLETQYLELVVLNQKLAQQLRQARESIQQLSQLRHWRPPEEKLLPARVTAAHISPPVKTLTLNRGQRHGVAVGMVVTGGYQLVGRVISTGPWTSTVKLITTTSPPTYLAVHLIPPVEDTSPREVATQLRISEQGDLFYARVDVNDPIRVGDLACLVDTRWPDSAQGLIVGQVQAIEPDAKTPLLRRRVKVKPLQALARLSQVVVIASMPTTFKGDE